MSYTKNNRSNRGNKCTIPCKYFTSGMTCMYGDQCQFLHDRSLVKSQSNKPSSTGKEQQQFTYHNPASHRGNEAVLSPGGFQVSQASSNFTSTSAIEIASEEEPASVMGLLSSLNLAGNQLRSGYNPNAEEFVPGVPNTKTSRSDNKSTYNQNSFTSPSGYNKLSQRNRNASLPAHLNRLNSAPNQHNPSTNTGLNHQYNRQLSSENARKMTGKSNRRPFSNNKIDNNNQYYQRQYGMPEANQEHFNKRGRNYFMNPQLRESLTRQRFMRLAEVNADEFGLPHDVKHYHSLYPLEMNQQDNMSGNFVYNTICFKAINSHDGHTYLLRRVIGFRASQSTSLEGISKWKKVIHSGIVQLHEVFTTKAFGDNSLIAVYDYYPGAETMQSYYFDTKQSYVICEDGVLRADVNMARNNIESIDENVIWKCVIQLTSALRLIHVAGLACQVLNITKVLITSRSRLRINAMGILDILENDNPSRDVIVSRQMADLVSLGRLLLALACRSLAALDPENYSQSLDFLASNYSSDLRDLIFGLITCQQHLPQVVHKVKNINDVMPLIGARFYTHINGLYYENDLLESELEKEIENDRLVRLLIKLGVVNDRPKFYHEEDWSETGDRYLLKLFRDYMFHQVKQDGSPWIDMSHMINCLNKLDIGSSDQICLSSRDEKSVLVVNFKDLKDCFERTIDELFVAAGLKNP